MINKLQTIILIFIGFSVMMLSCGEPEIEVKEVSFSHVKENHISDSIKNILKNELDPFLKDQNRYHGFNGSVLIAKNKEVIFKGDFGKANFSTKEIIDSSYSFQLASLSKQFTAAAIVLLQQDGKIDYDDTITKYFPNFHYSKATIRQCLNHTAGLPKYFWIAEHKWSKDHYPTNMEMMEMMEDDDVMQYFSPGAKYTYSNTAYFVLASVIEKVSGMSYSKFLEKRIFGPLQMNNSYAFSHSYDKVKPNQISGYRPVGGRYRIIPSTINDAILGDKNIYSNKDDLFKWYLALNSSDLFNDTNRTLIYTKGKTNRGYEIPYGFGFHIEEIDGHKVIYHNGKWNGFRNGFKQYPDEDLLIIVLEHSSYSGLNAFVNRIKNTVNSHSY